MAEKPTIEAVEAQLAAAQWTVRRDALESLRQHEPTDKTLSLLRRHLENDADVDVRATALLVMADMHPNYAPLVDELDSESPPMRLAAALGLRRASPDLIKVDVQRLWRIAAEENELAIQAALLKVLLEADRDIAAKGQGLLGGFDLAAVRAGALATLLTNAEDHEELDRQLSSAAGRLGSPEQAFELDRQRFESAISKTKLLNEYIDSSDISPIRGAFVVLHFYDVGQLRAETTRDLSAVALRISGALDSWAETVLPSLGSAPSYDHDLFNYTSSSLSPLSFQTPLVEEALEGISWVQLDPPPWPKTAFEYLKKYSSEFTAEASEAVERSLWAIVHRTPEALEVLLSLRGADAVFGRLPEAVRDGEEGAYGRALLIAERGPHLESIRDHASVASVYVLHALRDPDPRIREAAADWFEKRASLVPKEQVADVTRQLT